MEERPHMAQVKLMDVVETLAEEIGPRPTGTEEEQRAATAIQQWLSRGAGLPAAIEEVDGEPELETTQTICFAVGFLATFLAYIVKPLALPAIILTLAAAVIVVLENLGHPVVTRFLRKGISQNVVAVYEPEVLPTEEEARRQGRARKIVLVAHYDSARVRAETNRGLAHFAALGFQIETWALVATPIVMLINSLFFMYDKSVVGTVFSVITVVLMVFMGLRLLKLIARRFAKYNDAANCNATGVAVLVDIAQRVNGSYAGPTKGSAVRHGAAAAQAANVVPEGAALSYDAPATEDDGFASAGMGEDAGFAGDVTWGTGAAAGAAAAVAGAAAGAKEASSPAAEDDEDAPAYPSWRGRATASRGYATVDSNLEISSRPLGSAPGSGFERYGSAPAADAAAAPAVPSDGPRTIRAELNDIDYMGDNPRLEAARAAVRAQRAAAADVQEMESYRDGLEGRTSGFVSGSAGYGVPRAASAAESDFGVRRTSGSAPVAISASSPAVSAAAMGTSPNTSRTAAGFDWVAAAAAASEEKAAAASRGNASFTPEPDYPADEAASAATVATPASPAAPAIPDWYARVKAGARRDDGEAVVARSRFNDALRDAESNFSAAPAAAGYSDARELFEPSADARAAAAVPASPVTGVVTELPAIDASVASAAGAMPAVQAEAAPARPKVTAYAIPIEQVTGRTLSSTRPVSTAAVAGVPMADEPVVREVAYAPAPARGESAAGVQTEGEGAANAPAAEFRPTTGFAGALAVAAAAEERAIAEGKLTPSPTGGIPQVALPEISMSAAMKPITMEDLQQRAPLAQAQTSGKDAAKSLLTMLPTISLDNPEDHASAAPAAEPDSAEPAPAAPAQPGHGAAGMTGIFAPVGNELLQNADEDIFVDDADDSAFQRNYTASGAFAGPGYVDMPKTRSKGLFGKIFGKKESEDGSMQDWLGVDDSFDARAVGAARGGWESFREDSGYGDDGYTNDGYGYGADGYDADYGYNDNPYGDEADDADTGENYGTYTGDYAPRDWNGGAFSLKGLVGRKQAGAGRRSGRRGDDAYDDGYGYDGEDGFDGAYGEGGFDEGYGAYDSFGGYDGFEDNGNDRGGYDDADEEEFGSYRRSLGADEDNDGGSLSGMASASDRVRRPGTMADLAAPSFADDEKDLQEIFDFRDANINAEVWFVALGSESPNNSGMKAFLDAHGSELRNALFIELEGLGAGELCLTSSEGRFRRLNISSRMRRYVQKAQEACKVKVGSCTYHIDNSATYVALSRGMQAMHLVGTDGVKPTLQNQADDVVTSIDAERLSRNADFVMALLRSI